MAHSGYTQDMQIRLTPDQVLKLALIMAPLLYALAVFYTRAARRRIVGSLCGAVTYAVLNLAADRAAVALGLWSFPAFPSSEPSPLLYLPIGLIYGGAVGLVGWRIIRRWHARGFLVFIAAWGVIGTTRDIISAAATAGSGLLVFAPGVGPHLADFFLWAACAAAAQTAMRLVAGPYGADSLAGAPTTA